MKAKLLLLAIAFFGYTSFSQVGINNTDPKASLDITATNAASPANTDGLLIPRIDDFPATNPTAAQQGMMVYLTTTSGANPPGFYFWDNNAGPAVWSSVVGGSVQKINDLSDGKSDNDGSQNGSSIFIGVNAGSNDDSSNNKNVGIGYSALRLNTTGSGNVAIGHLSLVSNTTGYSNTANGNDALRFNTTGYYNTAIGNRSIYFNTVGFANTAIGYNSLESNTTGEKNNAFGTAALFDNTTGDDNIAMGYAALSNNTNGNFNIALGTNALLNSISGSNNIGIGYQALLGNSTNNIIAIGYQALRSNTSGNNIAVGYQSLFSNTTGRYNTAIGFQSLYSNVFGQKNTANGYQALYYNTQNNNTANGYQALYSNTSGSSNTATGTLALADNITGTSNTATGSYALASNTTGRDNTAHGAGALLNNITGNYNTANGSSALFTNTTGRNNTAIGYQSLRSNTTGFSNSSIGYQSLYSNTTGNYNTANGILSLYSNTTGGNNLSLGYQSLQDNTTGNSNTALGYRALFNSSTGNGNTAIGSFAGGNNSTGTGNVFIGGSAGSNELGSNTLYIQNNSVNADNALIYGEFDNDILRTNSEFQIGNPTGTGYAFPTVDGTATYILQTDGAGQISFINPSTIGDGTGTDDQNISGSGLSGTNLTIGIENGSSQIVDLSSLQDADWYDSLNTPPNSINDDIYTDGKVGINNPTPIGYLDIRANSGSGIGHLDLTETQANDGIRMFFRNSIETTNYWTLYAKADNTAGNGVMNFFSSEVSTNILRLESDGKVGIMRNPTTNPLEVEGVASKTTAGSWAANSDRRLKKNIVSISGLTALGKISEMHGVTYEWDDDKTGTERPSGIQYGFIAQDLMEVFPEKVSKDNLGYYQTAYGDYDPLFVEAFKELNSKIETLSEENKKIAAENFILTNRLGKIELLEARLNALENFDKNNTDTTNSLAEKK